VKVDVFFEIFVCFFRKSMFGFCMHCVDARKSYKFNYKGRPSFKLCGCWVGYLKVRNFWVMFIWV